MVETDFLFARLCSSSVGDHSTDHMLARLYGYNAVSKSFCVLEFTAKFLKCGKRSENVTRHQMNHIIFLQAV
jgi:hypothetical protein